MWKGLSAGKLAGWKAGKLQEPCEGTAGGRERTKGRGYEGTTRGSEGEQARRLKGIDVWVCNLSTCTWTLLYCFEACPNMVACKPTRAGFQIQWIFAR